MEALQTHIQATFPFIGKTMSLALYQKKEYGDDENQKEFYTIPNADDPNSRELVAQYLFDCNSMSGDPGDFDDVLIMTIKSRDSSFWPKIGSTIQPRKWLMKFMLLLKRISQLSIACV
jgi:hypothetical protein